MSVGAFARTPASCAASASVIAPSTSRTSQSRGRGRLVLRLAAGMRSKSRSSRRYVSPSTTCSAMKRENASRWPWLYAPDCTFRFQINDDVCARADRYFHVPPPAALRIRGRTSWGDLEACLARSCRQLLRPSTSASRRFRRKRRRRVPHYRQGRRNDRSRPAAVAVPSADLDIRRSKVDSSPNRHPLVSESPSRAKGAIRQRGGRRCTGP
jgi:hypothetical protein